MNSDVPYFLLWDAKKYGMWPQKNTVLPMAAAAIENKDYLKLAYIASEMAGLTLLDASLFEPLLVIGKHLAAVPEYLPYGVEAFYNVSRKADTADGTGNLRERAVDCVLEHAQEVPEFYTRYGHFLSASVYAVTPEQRQRAVDGFFVAAASSAVLTERLDAYSSGVSYEAIKDGCFARFYAEASEQPKGSADAIEACRRLAHYADDNSGWQKKGIDALAANMKGLEPKACLNVCVEIEKNEPLDSKLSAFATCQFMLALLRIDNLADRAKAQVEAIRKVRDEKKSPSFLVAYVATEGLPCCADAMVSVEGKREAWTWVARYATKDALRSSARARIAELDAVEKPVRIEPENKQARAFLDKFDFK